MRQFPCPPRCFMLSLFLLCGCAESLVTEDEFLEEEQTESGDAALEPLALSGINADRRSVQNMVTAACSTTSVKGLSQQLVEEINCLSPGTLSPIKPQRNLSMAPAVFPYLQSFAAAALERRVARSTSTLYLNSALRTLPQQYLLYNWYRSGRCGIGLAASPGTSNHESGLAVDLNNPYAWRSSLAMENWRWLGPSDAVHFDYVGASKNISSLSVLAFQRLWNRNNPSDRIAEDGDYGATTERKLRLSPAVGFPQGAQCATASTPELGAIETYWYRNPDASYNLRALAPSSVVTVHYKVDGYLLKKVSRTTGANFPTQYTFSQEGQARRMEIEGFDKSGRKIALGTGLLDVTPEVGMFIRQRGDKLWSIGLERAPQGVSHIEVDLDQYSLGTSKGTNTSVITTQIFSPGTRTFTLRSYGSDGRLRGTLRRTFTLK